MSPRKLALVLVLVLGALLAVALWTSLGSSPAPPAGAQQGAGAPRVVPVTGEQAQPPSAHSNTPPAEAPSSAGQVHDGVQRAERTSWSARVVVTVLRPDGSPAPGVDVTIKGCLNAAGGATDGTGRVSLECEFAHRIDGAAPEEGKAHPVSTSVEVFTQAALPGGPCSASGEVKVEERKTAELTLQLQPGRTLVIELDEKLVAIEAKVFGPDQEGEAELSWFSGKEHRYLAYAPGTYRVCLLGAFEGKQSLEFRWAEGRVEVGNAPQTRLRLTTEAFRELEVHLEDPRGQPTRGWLTLDFPEGSGWDLGWFVDSSEQSGSSIFASVSPFKSSYVCDGSGPLRLRVPPARWRLRAVGSDPNSILVEKEITLVGQRQSETLRLEQGPVTEVELPVAQLSQSASWCELHLQGPPGISLCPSDAGVQVLGLSRDAAARLFVLERGARESATGVTRVAFVELRGGVNATANLQRVGRLQGSYAGAKGKPLLVEFAHEELATFPTYLETTYSQLRETQTRELKQEGGVPVPEGRRVQRAWRRSSPLPQDPLTLNNPIGVFLVEGMGFGVSELVPGRYRAVFHDAETYEVLGEGPGFTVVPGEEARLNLVAPPR